MKRLSVVLLTLLLVGCGPAAYTETSIYYKLPPELNHCKVFALEPDGVGTVLRVVVCPNAQTTTNFATSNGKVTTQHYTTVVG